MLLLISIFASLTACPGWSLVLDSRVSLPTPSKMDSSLSPKLVRAFYQVNFIPSQPGIDNKLGSASISFTPSKVATVLKIEDLVEKLGSELIMDDPPLQSSNNHKEVATLIHEIERISNSSKNHPSSTSNQEVPVYKGTVSVGEVLARPEARPYRPPGRPYYNPGWNPYTRPPLPYQPVALARIDTKL